MNPNGLARGTRTSRLMNGYCPDCVPLEAGAREPVEWIQELGAPPRVMIRYRCRRCGVVWLPREHLKPGKAEGSA